MSILDTAEVRGTESCPQDLYIAELFGVSPVDEETGSYRRFGQYIPIYDNDYTANLVFAMIPTGFANSEYTIRGAPYVKFIGTTSFYECYVCCMQHPSRGIWGLQDSRIDIIGDDVSLDQDDGSYADSAGNVAMLYRWTWNYDQKELLDTELDHSDEFRAHVDLSELPSVTLSTGEWIYTNRGLDADLDRALEFTRQDMIASGGRSHSDGVRNSILDYDQGMFPGIDIDELEGGVESDE
jgi:hypothetical protein